MKTTGAFVFCGALLLGGCQALSAGGPYPSEAAAARIQSGDSRADVRALLGEPYSVDVYHRLSEEVWRYDAPYAGRDETWVTFSLDGLVTAVQQVPFVEPNVGIF